MKMKMKMKMKKSLLQNRKNRVIVLKSQFTHITEKKNETKKEKIYHTDCTYDNINYTSIYRTINN
jgi:hypothetical protein